MFVYTKQIEFLDSNTFIFYYVSQYKPKIMIFVIFFSFYDIV